MLQDRDTLRPLQKRVLALLADLHVPRGWTLTGGAALAGFYTGHRETRDIDLFWYGEDLLGRIPQDVVALLRAAGLDARNLQTTPTFARLVARDSVESVVVDLVATPELPLLPPNSRTVHSKQILVESEHDIAVNKVTTLLSRCEIRDLWDLQVLLERGASLRTLLEAAPRKDGGFSPVTLAWLVRQMPLERLAKDSGLSDDLATRLASFRDTLVEQLVDLAAEEDSDSSTGLEM
jgi:hypothetical protein